MPATRPENRRTMLAWVLVSVGAAGWIASFALTLKAFADLADFASIAALPPGALVLGVPPAVLGVAGFVVPIALGVAMLAGARVGAGFWGTAHDRRPLALAIVMVLSGVVGFWAAFTLTIDKVLVIAEPSPVLGCNFSLLVQCGANLESWQGSVFGFPNPLLGVAGWVAVLFVGVATLAGARFAPWFWVTLNAGVFAAMAFVVWLISQSIFELGTLCPWCMATWAVTIPLFWSLTLFNARSGHFGNSGILRRIGTAAYSWVPFITLASYLAIAIVAQLRLDVLSYL